MLKFFQLKKYEEAIIAYNRTIELEDPTSYAFLRIGKCYERLGDKKLAIEFYNKTVHEDPLLDKGWIAITDFYLRQKNYQKALREYGRFLFHEEHNNQEAKQVLIKSLKLNPNDDQALELLGSAEAELGYLLKSLEYLSKSSQINPKSASVWANLYITYTRLGDKANAQIAINKGMEIDKDVVKKLMTVKAK